MDKKPGPERGSSKSLPNIASATPKTDSGQAGKGSNKTGYYIDELGRVCYGNQCVKLAIDEVRREVVVNVKPGAACDVEPVVEALRKTLGSGARTVYEVESEYQEI
jgi:hypothetical protein